MAGGGATECGDLGDPMTCDDATNRSDLVGSGDAIDFSVPWEKYTLDFGKQDGRTFSRVREHDPWAAAIPQALRAAAIPCVAAMPAAIAMGCGGPMCCCDRRRNLAAGAA